MRQADRVSRIHDGFAAERNLAGSTAATAERGVRRLLLERSISPIF
ncbi:L-aminopeptidase/D-esterase [Pseudomonas sp. GR 6-02]|nr:L-aminopeptidase/D-esterase [Pseudomonas sp. GR 6-02]